MKTKTRVRVFTGDWKLQDWKMADWKMTDWNLADYGDDAVNEK